MALPFVAGLGIESRSLSENFCQHRNNLLRTERPFVGLLDILENVLVIL